MCTYPTRLHYGDAYDRQALVGATRWR